MIPACRPWVHCAAVYVGQGIVDSCLQTCQSNMQHQPFSPTCWSIWQLYFCFCRVHSPLGKMLVCRPHGLLGSLYVVLPTLWSIGQSCSLADLMVHWQLCTSFCRPYGPWGSHVSLPTLRSIWKLGMSFSAGLTVHWAVMFACRPLGL